MDKRRETMIKLERNKDLHEEGEYPVEELFQYVLDKFLKDFAFFPEELERLEIPLEFFEKLLREKVGDKEDVMSWIVRMIRQGFIEYHQYHSRDHTGNPMEIQMIKISRERIPREIPKDIVMRRVSDFYSAYQQLYHMPLQPGTIITPDKLIEIEALSRKQVLYKILKPLIDKGFVTLNELVEIHEYDISADLLLFDIMAKIGIVQYITGEDEKDRIDAAKFLVDKDRAYELIRKFFNNKEKIRMPNLMI